MNHGTLYFRWERNKNKPKMAYSRDAIVRDQQETRERKDQSETSVRLERGQRDYMEIWRMAYQNLTRYLRRARERASFRQLGNGQTDRQMD